MKCEWCENEMEPHPYGMPKKYCSVKCRKHAEKHRYYKRHHVSCMHWTAEKKVVKEPPVLKKIKREPVPPIVTEEQRIKNMEYSRQRRIGKSYAGERARRRLADPLHDVKESARTKLRSAVKKGEIIKPLKCQRCGAEERLQGHHYRGYQFPLIVIWLCNRCHAQAHVLNKGIK